MGQLSPRALWVSSALVLCLIAACTTSRTHMPATAETVAAEPTLASAPADSATRTPAPSQASAPWNQGVAVLSNAGTYRVVYRSSPTPIPRGDVFALDVWVFGAGDEAHPLHDVALTVDAGMPEHQHGMNRRPIVRPLDAGGFRVEGLLFHMSGRWELYFDVTRGAITERAQVSVELP